MLRYVIGMTLLALLASVGSAQDKPKEDKAVDDSLVGTYTIVKAERDGKPLPEDHTKNVTIQIAKNAITTFDRDRKQVYAATYELNKKTKPWSISMTAKVAEGKGTKSHGLLKKEGEVVKLIYALPGGEMPTDFETKQNQQLFVLKQVKEKAKEK